MNIDILSSLFFKILPLYSFIVLGVIAGKVLHAQRETLARILIYIVAPVVVFYGMITRPFALQLLSLPVLFYCCSTLLALTALHWGKRHYKDATPNLLAFTAASGNTGYFGLPVAISFLGESAMPVAVMGIISTIFFECTLGFYLTARGNYSTQESIKKLLRIPTVYTFFLGLLAKNLGYTPSLDISQFFSFFTHSYTLLGMMIIGIALSKVRKDHLDLRFILSSLIARFLIWPIVLGAFVLLDHYCLHLFDKLTHAGIILISLLPIAANTVVFATELKVMPEKAATAVFISTSLGIFIVPFAPLLAQLINNL